MFLLQNCVCVCSSFDVQEGLHFFSIVYLHSYTFIWYPEFSNSCDSTYLLFLMNNDKINVSSCSCLSFPFGLAGKESACNVGDLGLIPGLGRSPEEGKGYPFQYSGLENSMDYSPLGFRESDMTERLYVVIILDFRYTTGRTPSAKYAGYESA